jgi:hypothetical protein
MALRKRGTLAALMNQGDLFPAAPASAHVSSGLCLVCRLRRAAARSVYCDPCLRGLLRKEARGGGVGEGQRERERRRAAR